MQETPFVFLSLWRVKIHSKSVSCLGLENDNMYKDLYLTFSFFTFSQSKSEYIRTVVVGNWQVWKVNLQFALHPVGPLTLRQV